MRFLTLIAVLLVALPLAAKKPQPRFDLGGPKAKIAKPASRPPKVKSGLLQKPGRKQQKQWEARNQAIQPRTKSEGETGNPPER